MIILNVISLLANSRYHSDIPNRFHAEASTGTGTSRSSHRTASGYDEANAVIPQVQQAQEKCKREIVGNEEFVASMIFFLLKLDPFE